MSFEPVKNPRVVTSSEVDALISCFEVNKYLGDDPSPIDDAINLDPELRRLNREAEKELLLARSEWAKLFDKNGIFRSSATRLKAEMNGDAGKCGFSLARAYRYLMSPAFHGAWEAKDYRQISHDLLKELLIGISIDTTKVKASFTEGLDRLLTGITKSKSVKRAIPMILMFLVMFWTLPNRRSSWSDLSGDFLMASLKTAVIYLTSIWVGIPLLEIIDHFTEARQDLSNAGYRGCVWAAALKSALRSSPVVSIPSSMLKSVGDHVVLKDLHPEFFCHESFVDNWGDMEIMEDPVFLHGFQTEREFAMKLVRLGAKHPITRKRILRAHIMEPTSEYKRLYFEYVQHRDDVIRDRTHSTRNDNL